ncbi:MAG: hypothetical protein ABSB77_19665 [Xanthobacteraceae bacterium]|jgi:hypothetical protein
MRPPLFAISAALVLACVGMPARATSVYDYKPNEYVIVDGGLAPNKRFSIAANGYRGFHVYLIAEPAHKPIAALASIDNDSILDTGPSAYHAVWSPDSRHLAMHFRSDRHALTMLLYEIRGGGPHLLDTPLLFRAATKLPDTSDDFEIRSDVTDLTWLSPTTFALKEQRTLEIKAPGLPKKLGPYGKPEAETAGGADGNQLARHFIKFSAEATGQVVPGRGYRILDMKPGTFE